jgi:ATP-dependent DNA helicase RecG
MNRFKNKESHVLVSTTVVEVGVDVPDATVIVIEHAERFGLSQLHQLRGRVGRSSLQSYCFLFTHPNTSEVTQRRLGLLEKTTDGFLLAEEDLKIRGPGEFLGVRQSGALPFRIAELVRDSELLELARNDAEEILKTDPHLELTKNSALKQYFITRGKLEFERFQTA